MTKLELYLQEAKARAENVRIIEASLEASIITEELPVLIAICEKLVEFIKADCVCGVTASGTCSSCMMIKKIEEMLK